MDVRVNIDSKWIPARDYQIDAFTDFQNMDTYRHEYVYNKNGYHFTIRRSGENNDLCHSGIWLYREDGTKLPIFNFSNVKKFTRPENQPIGWYQCSDAERDAYVDFIYSGLQNKDYLTIGQKVFTLNRNENYTVEIKYEGDEYGTRLSDNEGARRYYHGFYMRMTDSGY